MIWLGAVVFALGWGQGQGPPPSAGAEVIAEVRVHGNHVTPDEDIIRMSGLQVGGAFTESTLVDVRRRLDAAHLFDDAEVLKRYASITDPSRILVLIIVNEGPVRVNAASSAGGVPTIVRRRGLTKNLMFLPILDAEDGYGATYGVRFAYVALAGRQSRLSFPLTWGGTKQAGVEFERTFRTGPLTRLVGGTGVQRRRNPAFDEDDTRSRLWARAERRLGPVRAGARTGWDRVSFAELGDDVTSVGADLTYDTRIEPIFPRNAVLASASWTSFRFASGGTTHRTSFDGRGYVGLFGQSVLVIRADREDANRPLPLYMKSLVGGWSSLRGFTAAAFTGDSAVTGSLEVRVPLSSTMGIGRFGISAFYDVGTAYDKGQQLRSQPLHSGAGAGVWWTATVFRLGLSVAHGLGAMTRLNFGGGIDF